MWERSSANKHTTELRQVWFPGNHGNVGGGWQDAGIANMSLACKFIDFFPSRDPCANRTLTFPPGMMDQLASVGVEFDEATIMRIFSRLESYYRTTTTPGKAEVAKPTSGKPWAVKQIYDATNPIRPWGQGALLKAGSFLYTLAGFNLRTPGLYRKIDIETGFPSRAFLEDTNERVHSSVRVRLATGGLGLNDGDL